MRQIRKIIAVIKKDFIIESSYKLGFIISFVNSFTGILSFYFVNKLTSGDVSGELARYGGNYFSFALVGVAFSNYFIAATTAFSFVIRRAQTSGCLEAILSSQTPARQVVLYSAFYSFLSALVQLLLTFIAGRLLFHISYPDMNITATLLTFLLSLLVFVSLGIISASGIMLFKQGEPFGWVVGAISSFLGGAYFPVSLMPQWLQYISMLVPISHSLEALRLAMLKGYSISMLAPQLLVLLGLVAVLLPFSLYFFSWSVEKGKREGSLMQY
jgi:ABC-2 type transport system permease protein